MTTAPVSSLSKAGVSLYPEIDPERVNEGAMPPIGFFDPWGLSKTGTAGTQAWFRAAELKHGRVCMAAFVGFLVQVRRLRLV